MHEDIMILNAYATDNVVSIHIMQNLIRHQGKINEDSTPLSQ